VRSFACPVCGHLVFFENSVCLHCGTELGYRRSQRELVALDGHVRCANAEVARCNWLVDAPGLLCGSCAQRDAVGGRVVTIDLAEGDDAHREALRVQLAEPYRTMLGHLRHETGHYYWTVLVEPSPSRFRELFGDERADYAEALQRHYLATGPARLT
jgi:hypothetical protein